MFSVTVVSDFDIFNKTEKNFIDTVQVFEIEIEIEIEIEVEVEIDIENENDIQKWSQYLFNVSFKALGQRRDTSVQALGV